MEPGLHAPFSNRFCPDCGRPIEMAWTRGPDGAMVPSDLRFCEPCFIGLPVDAPWPVHLSRVEDDERDPIDYLE
jgi:hypothetical protein